MQRRSFLRSIAAGPAVVLLPAGVVMSRPSKLSPTETEIEDWKMKVDQMVAEIGLGPAKPPGKPTVTIRNIHIGVDLRGEDPDRALRAFMEPIERLATRA